MSVRAALSTDQVQLTGYQYPLVEAFRESVVHVHVASGGNWKHRAMDISFVSFWYVPSRSARMARMGNSGLINIPLTDEECSAVGA